MAMNPYFHIKIDPGQLAYMREQFAQFPRTIQRICKESINLCASKARTKLVDLGSKFTKIPKRTIRRFTSIRKATNKDLVAEVRVFSRRIPVRYMGMQVGPMVDRKIETTQKQSLWLYHNVFKTKYGKEAKYNRKKPYTITRKVPSFITYKRGRRDITLPPNTFIAKFPRTGYFGAFTKKASGGTRNGKLLEVTGPSVGEVLHENKQDVVQIQKDSMAMLNSDIEKRIGRYIVMRNKGVLPGYGGGK